MANRSALTTRRGWIRWAIRTPKRCTSPSVSGGATSAIFEIQATIDDPKAYTKPWNVTQPMVLLPDTDLLELVHNENNRDLPHLNTK